MAQGDSPAGATLGHYEILEELGRGGMGVVYKAHDRKMDRVVALKVLPSRYAQDPLFVQRFEREARAAAGLNHPNTVRVFAAGEDRGHHFIAMQFVEGQTLKERIAERGRLGVDEALAITRQVAEALGEAHEHGIIHRDIKPGNIMLEQDGRAVLMDFGLAKAVQSASALTEQGVQVGTPLYMAPEQIQGHTLDARTDIYSLGLTLYEMLAGEPPFEPGPTLAMMYKVLNEPLPDLRERNPVVAAGVLRLVASMTAKDLAGRYASAAELCANLDVAARGGLPLAIARDLTTDPGGQSTGLADKTLAELLPRGRRTRRYFLGVVVATLLSLAAAMVISGRDGPAPADEGLTPAERSEDGSVPTPDSTGSEQDGPPRGRPHQGPEDGGEERTFAGIEMVWIPPGTFTMGSPAAEERLSREEAENQSPRGGVQSVERYQLQQVRDETQHQVTLTKGFWLGKYEVTQVQWQAVMGSNPSHFKGSNLPVECVSWDDCQDFIRKLNARGHGTFRLPTEVEWECACRAGTTTPFYFGETISTFQANYNGNKTYGSGRKGVYREKTVAAGSFPANRWGLYDMHGNVYEWCQDWKGGYPSGSVTDPTGPSTGSDRVARGGCWGAAPWAGRSAHRIGLDPSVRAYVVGFRLARDADR